MLFIKNPPSSPKSSAFWSSQFPHLPILQGLRAEVFFSASSPAGSNTNILMSGTVDGDNPAPPDMYKNPVNDGINYQPQLVFSPDFWLPSTV